MSDLYISTGVTTVWVDAFKVGDLVSHPRYGEQRYTEKQLLEAVRNFRDLTTKGYETTLLREHGREDSYQYGKIHNVRISEDGYFQCAVEFYRLADREAFNEGILREFSPGFAHEWLDPHTNEKMQNVLLELSFTSRAYQRNLRPPQSTNPGVVLSDNMPTSLAETPSGKAALQGEDPMEEEEVAEEVTEEEQPEFSQESAFSALSAKMDTLMEMLKPKEEEQPEMNDDVTEVEKLSAQVAQLNGELLTAKLSAKGVEADRIPTLVALSQTATPEQFAEIVNYAATPANTTVIQAEVGATGSADIAGGEASAADIVEEAKAAGVEYGAGGFSLWVSDNYPERSDEIVTYASR